MSATNTTTNYGLPIFIETDKPAWLVDFNGAMRTIDTTLKANADSIAAKENALTFADSTSIDFTRTGNSITAALDSSLESQIARSVVKPLVTPSETIIPAIDSSGTQIDLTIGNGIEITNNELSGFDFNYGDYQTATLTAGSNCTQVLGSLYYRLNADNTIGEIYGLVSYRGESASSPVVIDTNITLPATGSVYSIYGNAMAIRTNLPMLVNMQIPTVRVSATGNVTISIPASSYLNGYVWFIATPIFF